MMLFRRAHDADLDQIFLLAKESGIGMTTLPKNKTLLAQRLHWSTLSYQKNPAQAGNEYYFFVLEDTESKMIVGTSAIEAATGLRAPFYSYKVSNHTRVCPSLHLRNTHETLYLVNDNEGCSELCTLFLKPQYRKNHNGLLLSKARFLFMAHAPKRFSSKVIAELRGTSDEQGRSPFWEHVGAHFFHMPFEKADELTLLTDKQFIADLMPKHPLYISLLPQEAQQTIGIPHASAMPAMTILLKEGFRYNHYIDIFDAGPTIEAPIEHIQSITQSMLVTVSGIDNHKKSPIHYLISNDAIDFRATIAPLSLDKEQQACILNQDTATALQVSPGDTIRIRSLAPN